MLLTTTSDITEPAYIPRSVSTPNSRPGENPAGSGFDAGDTDDLRF